MKSAGGEPIQVDFATEKDDAGLRRLLREIPMPGWLTVSMEREPSFFLATTIEGGEHDIVIARLQGNDELLGMGSRSVHRAFVNGHPTRLGYLSEVRISPAYRGGKGILKRGYAKLRERHLADTVRLYITTIIEDNTFARRALATSRPGIPPYTEQGILSTLLIPMLKRNASAVGDRFVIRRATADLLPQIAACLQREYTRYQFAPVWTPEDLASATRVRGLQPKDFLVVLNGDQVTGCIAVWDQRSFKQIVVRKYAWGLGHAVPAVNWFGPKVGLPRLPSEGEVCAFAYLSHFSANPEEPELALALVGAALEEAQRRGLSFVAIGLADRHPLCSALKQAFFHMEYRSVLYTVHWDEEGAAVLGSLDGRIPHAEVALL
jgi:ribosomal protein S18 acetylase RimI-like enzyme